MEYDVIINYPGEQAQRVRSVTRARMLALVDYTLRLNPEAQVTIVRRKG